MREYAYGRDILCRSASSSRLEWLVTNGIGGYGCGALGLTLERRYHGLLVAALQPPVGRTLLLAKFGETLLLDGVRIPLDANRWSSGWLDPRGDHHLESFRLEGAVPVWTWAIGDTRLEKRVWMEHGENTTYVEYRLLAGRRETGLELKAFANHRDAHAVTSPGTWTPRIEAATGGLVVEMFEGARPLWILAPGATIEPASNWYRNFALRLETERGLEDVEDHLHAGTLRFRLAPGEAALVTASTRHDAARARAGPLALATALARRHAHEKSVLDAWTKAQGALARRAPGWVRQLVLAADAFVVERSAPGRPNGRSIIAGYPWFSDWGRDTMIALPGLALVTGRPEIARAILETYCRHVDQGMLPNVFPDGGEAPEYNTMDAALWLFQAVRAYHETTDDDGFLAEVLPVLEDIGAWYERGTRHGIRVDKQDGLVRGGEPGVQITWMDAKVDDWVVTPRQGKPVEINALWYSALRVMAQFARRLKRPDEAYDRMADQVELSFRRFWNPETGCLYDVLDGPRGHDASVRPNQVFALSLPESPLDVAHRRAALTTVGRRLLTSHGLRSLAPDDPAYHGTFVGNRRARDAAYHQGTVWTWLLPHYALAHWRVTGERDGALALLEPLADLTREMGVGTLPEVADGEPPHRPRGCFAQAWSVAETLRAWHVLSAARAPAKPRTTARGRAAAKRATAPASERPATERLRRAP
jgi:predicted glycogen debranching enzyme